MRYQRCFNSRAREGRDTGHAQESPRCQVSIHAPARGATDLCACGGICQAVSIHAPARGATAAARYCRPSRTVSIHAPARGATRKRGLRVQEAAFQFTRPRGARPGPGEQGKAPSRFQFTRPRGARHRPRVERLGDWCFNSRAREGRDILMFPFKRPSAFQFTRPRGARRARLRPCGRQQAFQFTRPRGARPPVPPPARPAFVSIHAPARGATQPRLSIFVDGYWFQFTRPRGARRRSARAP